MLSVAKVNKLTVAYHTSVMRGHNRLITTVMLVTNLEETFLFQISHSSQTVAQLLFFLIRDRLAFFGSKLGI